MKINTETSLPILPPEASPGGIGPSHIENKTSRSLGRPARGERSGLHSAEAGAAVSAQHTDRTVTVTRRPGRWWPGVCRQQ